MDLAINYEQRAVSFQGDDSMPLFWVSFGLESACLWLMGRAFWRLEFTRTRNPITKFQVSALDNPRLWQTARPSCSTLETLSEDGGFPRRPADIWPNKWASTTGNVTKQYRPDPQSTIAGTASSLADTVVSFFRRGAVRVQAQHALAMIQIVGFGVRESQESAADNTLFKTVSTLCWPG